MNRPSKGALIAVSIAAMFAARGALAAEDAGKQETKVKCSGVNECAGKGACASKGNECSGKNKCKGMGMTMMTPKDCAAKGGKVEK